MQIPIQIIEDNKAAASALIEMLSENKNINIIDVSPTLADGEIMLYQTHPALLFIDVELPDGNGIEFWETLRKKIKWNTYVIFYTAFDHYAISALRAKAHDYLLKPLIREEFNAAMKRFLLHCAEKFAEGSNNNATEQRQTESTTLFVIDPQSNHIAIRPAEIGYFSYQTDRKLWEVHCANGHTYILRHGVNSTRLLKISPDFKQIHKSYIVNITYISRMEGSRVILQPPFNDAEEILVGKSYRSNLYNHFFQL